MSKKLKLTPRTPKPKKEKKDETKKIQGSSEGSPAEERHSPDTQAGAGPLPEAAEPVCGDGTAEAGLQDAATTVQLKQSYVKEGQGSNNIDGLGKKLAHDGIHFEYERAQAKDGTMHWNYSAKICKDDKEHMITGRIIENATDVEISGAYEEILAAFSSY